MRASLVFAAGVLVGGLAVGAVAYYAERPARVFSAAGSSPNDAQARRSGLAALFGHNAPSELSISTDDRLALHEYAASDASPDELEAMIRRAAAAPPSRRRSFELDTLLTRLGETDPAAAVRVARSLRVEPELVAPVLVAWAERDPRAALAELRRIDDPAAARTFALALLDVFGNDERGLERFAGVLPEPQMRAFRLDAIVRLADRDPAAALERASSLPDPTARSRTAARIAVELARRDPAAAIARIDTIADEEARRAFQSAALNEWARIDPAAVFAYIRSDAGRDLPATAGLAAIQSVADADPQSLLAVADELRPEMRSLARQAALRAIAEQDPEAAIAILDASSTPNEREMLLSVIGDAYGRRDPERALEWARSRPESANAMAAVLSGIAATNPGRAIELLLEQDEPGARPGPVPSLAVINVLTRLRGSSELATFATRLLDTGTMRSSSYIRPLVTMWATEDPDAALEWTLANAERFDGETLSMIARQVASRDPLTAVRALDSLPMHLREEWLTNVAGSYAQHDPGAAVSWVMQHQGQPGFEQAVSIVAQGAAISDPQAAVLLLERVGLPIEPPVAVQVAAAWASREPAAAADWVLRLPDSARRSAAGPVVSSWTARDPEAAKQWALGLSDPAMRDDALAAMLPALFATQGSVDLALLDAFGSDAARQNAILNTIGMIASRSRTDARRLVDAYISNPVLRDQAHDMIDNPRNPASSFFVPPPEIRAIREPALGVIF